MSKITCLVIVFFVGLKESISEEDNVTVSLNATLKLQNYTSPSNAINIKAVTSEQRDLSYSDNKYSTASRRFAFSDFLNQAVGILISYDDQDLEDIFVVMDEEVRKYRYNGKGIKTWARSSDTLKRILKQLEIMKEMSGHKLRRNLNKIYKALQQNKLDDIERQFIDFIDSLYSNDTAFLSVINDLNQFKYKFKRSNIYLSDMVKKSLQTLIFDPYNNMELNNKNALNFKIDIFMKKLPVSYREHNYNVKYVKTIKQRSERDEDSTNIELQFMPELKVREIHAAIDRLKKNQYGETSLLQTTPTTRIPENKYDERQQQNTLKRSIRHRIPNIDIATSNISRNEDLLNFILSHIGSIGDSRSQTSTTESGSQADMLMSFLSSLIKGFHGKITESNSEDKISYPESRSKNIYISHGSKDTKSQLKPLNLKIELVGLPRSTAIRREAQYETKEKENI